VSGDVISKVSWFGRQFLRRSSAHGLVRTTQGCNEQQIGSRSHRWKPMGGCERNPSPRPPITIWEGRAHGSHVQAGLGVRAPRGQRKHNFLLLPHRRWTIVYKCPSPSKSSQAESNLRDARAPCIFVLIKT